MEMENKQQQQIQESKEAKVNAEIEANDIEFEKRKAEVTKEVQDMLKEKGIEVIPMDYDCGNEMVKIVENYWSEIEKIDKEIKHNSERYSNSVAKEKNIHLNLDKKDLLYESNKALDNILEKQEKIQQMKIEELQTSKEYKEAKSEAFGVLNLLKDCDIPTEQLLQIINPLVESSDTKALGIARTLLQKNNASVFAIDKAIQGINASLDNTELKEAVETMRKYMKNGEENFSVFSLKSKYRKK